MISSTTLSFISSLEDKH
uniref:Uncharacterized protein n=1 Tax=Rhizophora mucronata TaxID=61149 RepID=A0A2P2QJR2_RHIMU